MVCIEEYPIVYIAQHSPVQNGQAVGSSAAGTHLSGTGRAMSLSSLRPICWFSFCPPFGGALLWLSGSFMGNHRPDLTHSPAQLMAVLPLPVLFCERHVMFFWFVCFFKISSMHIHFAQLLMLVAVLIIYYSTDIFC